MAITRNVLYGSRSHTELHTSYGSFTSLNKYKHGTKGKDVTVLLTKHHAMKVY